MNAINTAPCSEVALAEIAGLASSILLKLTKGPNRRKWLGWLKAFDRKVNPWVRSRDLVFLPSGARIPTLNECLADLATLDIEPFTCLADWANEYAHPSLGLHPEIKLVEVRLGDLVCDEEATLHSYSDILVMAEEKGFGRCDPRLGLSACVTLARKAVGAQFCGGSPVTYLVCTDPIQSEREPGVDRVPEFWVWSGARLGHGQSQGGVTLYAVDMQLEAPNKNLTRQLNLMANPDTRLILTSEM